MAVLEMIGNDGNFIEFQSIDRPSCLNTKSKNAFQNVPKSA